MKNNSDWEKILAKKLAVNPPPDFDKKFWSEFQQQFAGQLSGQQNSTENGGSFWQRYIAPWSLGLGLSTALIVLVAWRISQFPASSSHSELQVAVVLEMGPALDQLASYSELDNIDLSDEEWKILAGEEVI